MAIAIALVLIFVLYLIDKHSRWRQAFKLTVGLIVLGIVSVGGFFGWQKYEAWQEARQGARQEAEYEAGQAKQAAQKQAELAKACKDWEDKHPIGSPPDKVYGDKQFFVLDPPQGCEGPLETDYNGRNVYAIESANPIRPKAKTKTESQHWAEVTTSYFVSIVKRCAFNVGTFPCGVGEEEDIATLNKGDRVQILSDKIRAPNGTEIYEVKFKQWTGWADASTLSLQQGEYSEQDIEKK